MKEVHEFELSNGIRVAYKRVKNTKIVHCGIFLNVGSRDETFANQGITHFWEHMAFKGTRKRSANDILNSVDSVGGELNAYTDKEKVVFYASVRDQYFERTVDVLADIALHSTFPARQIEKERDVILQEMAMYLDNPDDTLQDEFDALIFKGHPMGMNILGRPDTIRSFRRSDFTRFFREHFSTRQVVFCCVGNLPIDMVEKAASTYLRTRPSYGVAKRVPAGRYRPRHVELQRAVKQARCSLGRTSFPVHHKNRLPFYLLVNMLGGPGMNSRLNVALRERHGYVYSVEAHYVPYSDTGTFFVSFGTKPGKLDRCIALVRKELDRFCDKKLTVRQLTAAKEQLKGQMAMAEEYNQNLMMMIGRMILDLGRVPSLEETFEAIDACTAAELRDLSLEMFDESKLSYLKMIPN
jgi:predicted Zn-dependent peptidase